ncbi:MAG: hypothetical protein AB7F96_16675 [Beijerinckiaceae bacterium]
MLRKLRGEQFGALFSEGVEAESAPSFEQRQRQRQAILEEDAFVGLLRWGCDALHLLHPTRIRSFPGTVSALTRPEWSRVSGPPDARYTRPAGNGFVAAATDTSLDAVLDAYGRGLILRWIAGIPAWWSPSQRIAGDPRQAREPEAALALLASGNVRITLDRDFESVASRATRRAVLRLRPFQPGRDGLAALLAVHDAGFAHSVEIRNRSGKLVGGCSGISSGRAFILQSRFGDTAAAAELALVILNRHLVHFGYAFIDLCADWDASHFDLPVLDRAEAQSCLTGCLAGDRRGRWLAVQDLCQ